MRFRPLTRSFYPVTLIALLLPLLAGCATRERRISRNLEFFNTLAPTDQQLIREGKVGVGFTPDMVRLAVGDPDRLWERTDATGRTEFWTYTTYDSATGSPLYRGYYHRYAGIYPTFDQPLFADHARAREYFRVSFRDGRVAEISQDKP